MVVVEDVHWAEPTLLDLLDYLVAFSSAHPILLVCNARPEFLETRPSWGTPQPNRSLVVLDAAFERRGAGAGPERGAAELGSQTAAQIVETADGNPLFLEQLVAVGAENGESALPSSIQAVLAARIDHLEPGERARARARLGPGPELLRRRAHRSPRRRRAGRDSERTWSRSSRSS